MPHIGTYIGSNDHKLSRLVNTLNAHTYTRARTNLTNRHEKKWHLVYVRSVDICPANYTQVITSMLSRPWAHTVARYSGRLLMKWNIWKCHAYFSCLFWWSQDWELLQRCICSIFIPFGNVKCSGDLTHGRVGL